MAREIRTKLAGVRWQNEDGTNRQELIEDLRGGDFLQLEREADNMVDSNAVAAYHEGQRVGYLNAELAAELAGIMDNGGTIEAQVLELTGGTKDKPTTGVNIELTIEDRDERQDAITEGLARLFRWGRRRGLI